MSLINQMLRDLQQRQGNRPAAPVAIKRPRRRLSVAGMLRSVPPLLWVGAGGVAGLALLWGAFGWLSTVIGPEAPAPVPQPPAELVAIARGPAPPATAPETPAAVRRRMPPVPIDVPPPAPPLAYGSPEPPMAVAVRSAAPLAVTSQPFRSPPLSAASPTPVVPLGRPVPVAASPGGAVPAVAAGSPVPVAASPPLRVHPDLLPGAVNATNLALQKAARAAAAPSPPAATPYGRAEEAYQNGRAAYDATRTDVSLAALHRALELYPGHLPARELLVDQLEMGGRLDEAYALLKQGLAIAPDYTPFRKRAARMRNDRGDAAGAVKVLTGNGLPRVEVDPELHRLLAGIYLQLGENFLAAQTYRNLVVYDPREGAYWLGLGDALAADGQPGEARRAYRKALAVGGLNREEAARAETGSARL